MSRQRKKKGRPISGWVVLDKPVGIGSTQCVGKIKWLYQAAKAGHAGTLDPLASGMLPLALGEATRTVPFIMGMCSILSTFMGDSPSERPASSIERLILPSPASTDCTDTDRNLTV